MLSRLLMLFIAAAFLIQPQMASAYNSSYPTAQDMPFLPPYCKAKMIDGPKSPQFKQWRMRLGEGFGHIHHYCAGLLFLKRANEAFNNKSDEKGLLEQALVNFDYVTIHAPQDFVLNPEIYVQSAKVNVRLNRLGAALKNFNKAIELNPNYAYGYMALSDFYKDIGEIEEAKKTIEVGLNKVPNSKGLKRRFKELKSQH